jgi:RNA polymerase sigma-70 factor (ECF subfamily)
MEICLLQDNVLSLRKLDKERCLEIPGDQSSAQILDAKLAEDCKGRSMGAYEQLYTRHGARMKSIALNILGNMADAEDAVQEAFLRIYRSIGHFRGESSFKTWIYRIVVNACYDLARKRDRRRPEVQERDLRSRKLEIPAPGGADHPLRMTLQQHLGKLDKRSRLVFLLFEVEGLKHREIAEILNISESMSKTVLFEAKRELQKLIWRDDTSERFVCED